MEVAGLGVVKRKFVDLTIAVKKSFLVDKIHHILLFYIDNLWSSKKDQDQKRYCCDGHHNYCWCVVLKSS